MNLFYKYTVMRINRGKTEGESQEEDESLVQSEAEPEKLFAKYKKKTSLSTLKDMIYTHFQLNSIQIILLQLILGPVQLLSLSFTCNKAAWRLEWLIELNLNLRKCTS